MNWADLLDEIKKPFYKVAAQDSRNMARFGNAIGWQGLEDEAKTNVKNPGRAIGKAAQYAATYYLGGLLGEGADAAAPAVEGAASAVPMTGMFANAGGAGINAMTQEQLAAQAMQQALAQQATQQAAQQAATQGGAEIAKQGMFQMVPGVSNGSQQAAMLAAQNEGLGGTAYDLTAQAAKPAVQDAYSRGGMKTLDYAREMGKADLAGMNDPNVWLARLARNGGRLSGNAAKSMSTNMLMQSMSPQGGARPASMPMRGQPQQPPPVDTAKLDTLKQRAIAGDPAALQELLALLGAKA